MNRDSQQTDNVSSQTDLLVGLTFSLDKDSNELKARFSPSEHPTTIGLNDLEKLISINGFSEVNLDQDNLSQLLDRINEGQACEAVIGKTEIGVGLRFEYDDQSSNLSAILEESQTPEKITFVSFKKRLENEGYGAFNIKKTVISDIIIKAQHKQYGAYILGQKPVYTYCQFSYNENENKLLATLKSSEEHSVESLETLKEKLVAAGFGDYAIKEGSLPKLLEQIKTNSHGDYVIGTREDAAIRVECDEHFMNAYISISPPRGGRELDEGLLDVALQNEGIYRGCCDEKALAALLKKKTADKVKFASGTEPSDGKDAEFEALVEEVVYNTPKESKTGKIDLRDIVSFTIIEANTPLMKRTPAIPGINGRNVKGQVIPATESVDTPFDEELIGAKISDEDPNILVSTNKGHPVILPSSVKVDNTIEVNNVDMSTGHINYDGSVLVKGEVKAGMKIKVSGDVIVKGVVTKASIYAKNNIVIECGVIGSDPAKDDESSPPAVIKAGGNVSAQYFNLAEVTAGRDIEVKEYLSHCTSEAKHMVLAGQAGGKGRIFGGSCYGRAGIQANSIGASGDIKTHLAAGTPPQQQKQFEQILKSHQNRIEQSKQLKSILKKYEDAKPDETAKITKAQAIVKVLADIQSEIKKLSSTITNINQVFKEAQSAQIGVRKSTFPNVDMTINGAEFHIRQESKGGVFVKQGKDIRWLNYSEAKKL